MRKRVVITGMGAVTPYGVGTQSLMRGLASRECGLSSIPEEMKIPNIDCHVAGFVPPIEQQIPRPIRRAMSPMSIFAYLAATEALEQAGLQEEKEIGVCLGTTTGSGQEMTSVFAELFQTGNLDAVRTMSFFKVMAHTASSNIAQSLALRGRTINPVSACAAGLQGIGLAYEAIAFGREKRMLCGGCEEYSILASATFDKIGAASNETDPSRSSLPFDKRRKGVVCSEGAGVLCLEEFELVRARGAKILAEIQGFATLSSPTSLSSPDQEDAARCMRHALTDAGIKSSEISAICAHATGTMAGDATEGRAIEEIFGDQVPVIGLKGYLGHTLAASGALETIACIAMMEGAELVGMPEDFEAAEDCGDFAFAEHRSRLPLNSSILKNSFALGGIYASLVLGQPVEGE